eukprot:g2896.t1
MRLLAVLAVAAVVHGGDAGDLSAPVAVLNDANFEEALDDTQNRVWMIEFYAPWCSHCKALAPVYEQAAASVKSMRFAKIDATQNRLYAGKFKVTGYPSLFWVREGRERRYRGGHSVQGFADLAEKLGQKAVQAYNAAFDKRDGVKWLLYNPGGQCADEAAAFGAAARRLQDELAFGSAEDAEGLGGAALKVAAGGGCAIAKIDGDEEPHRFAASGAAASADALVEWIERNKFPLVSALNAKTFYAASHAGRKLVAAVVDGAGSKVAGALREELKRLARPGSATAPLGEEPSAKFLFGVMDGKEKNDEGKDLVGEFLAGYGVDVAKDLPQVVVFDIADRNAEAYYTGGVQAPAQVEAFVKGVLDGSVKPQYQGVWGKPEKIWRSVKSVAPFLAPLDVLPQFAFVVPSVLLLLFFVVRLLCLGDDDYEEEEEQEEDKKSK